MTDHWERVQSLFGRARELPAAEREDFVRRECGDDAELRDEVLTLLSAADVTLCPGYPGEYNRFRLAGKIVEYMIAGRPMLCYASGIGEDLVDGEDALLLDPYTPDHVSAQLARAADPALRCRIGRRARALAEEWFDVRPLAARLATFYRDAAGTSG